MASRYMDMRRARQAMRDGGDMAVMHVALLSCAVVGLVALLATASTMPLAWLSVGFLFLAACCAGHSAELNRQAAKAYAHRATQPPA